MIYLPVPAHPLPSGIDSAHASPIGNYANEGKRESLSASKVESLNFFNWTRNKEGKKNVLGKVKIVEKTNLLSKQRQVKTTFYTDALSLVCSFAKILLFVILVNESVKDYQK